MSLAVADDPQVRARDAVRQISAVATLPEATARIIAMVEDPRSSAGQLHRLVSHDPALVTRILKLVNSSFYGVPGRISSIERAVVLLGLSTIRSVAVAASMGQLFRGARLCEEFTTGDLWTHSVAVAVAARELARQIKAPLVEEAFLAGMIHDVGLLVSLQLWPDQLRATIEAAQHCDLPFHEMELKMIGVDHQKLGGALAECWKFPLGCQLAAAYHHEPTRVDGVERLLVSLVHTADVLCCRSKHGFNLTARHEAVEHVGMHPSIDLGSIANVERKLDELVAAAGPMMG